MASKAQLFFLGLNVLLSFLLLKFFFTLPGDNTPKTYTYVGDDYPIELPLDEELPFVAMTLHESVHYDMNISDSSIEREWDTLMLYPRGFGRAHLGPEYRVFNVVFWHQMHCLRTMVRGIQGGTDSDSPEHIRHCLNYLRQTFLCAADHTLEEGDFMNRDFEAERIITDTRMCRDWETVERKMNEKMLKYFDWIHKHHPEMYSDQ